MTPRLAKLASAILVVLASNAQAGSSLGTLPPRAPSPAIPLLTAEQARDPALVIDALRARLGGNPHAATAKFYFEHGLNAQDRQYWGLAAKAFGESMIRAPSAQALIAHGHAELRMLGEIRAREGKTAEKAKSDLAYCLGFYRSAMAADDVFHHLNATERAKLAEHTKCLADFVDGPATTASCKPAAQYLSGS